VGIPLYGTRKRRLAEKVRRAVSAHLADDGWSRTKTSFWTRRPEAHHVEFFHLHLFTFAPEFRVHLGVRVLADPFDACGLNGPITDSTSKLVFSGDANTAETCATGIAAFVRAGEKWFAKWRTPDALLRDGSPLDADAKSALREAIEGRAARRTVAASLHLLGLDK
jgi:hypothetical protein